MTAAAFDYPSLATKAQNLITEFGRPATLTRAARVTAAAPDVTKPWLPVQGDAADAAAQSILVSMVFLSLVREDRDGQVVEAKTQSVLIGSGIILPEEIGTDWKVTDGTRSWEVMNSLPLQPGPTLMIYRLELGL